MLNYLDCTLKARIQHVEDLTCRLIELGAQYMGLDRQHDTYFEVPHGKLKYRKGTLGTLITHYERTVVDLVEKTQVYRYDVNPSEDEVKKLYDRFDLIGEIHKSRSLYQKNNLTIHLDKLENGEEFIEVEAKDFEDLYSELELQNQCQQIFENIGISKDELLTTGYIQL